MNGALAQNAQGQAAQYNPVFGGQAAQQQATTYNPAMMNAQQSGAQVNPQTINPAQMGAATMNASTGTAAGYDAATGQAQGYQAGTLGPAATYGAQQATSQGFNAAQQSPAAQMNAAQVAQTPGAMASQATGQGFNAAQIDPASGYSATGFDKGNLQNVSAGRVSSTNLDPYMNPYTQNVIDSTTREMNRNHQMTLNDVGAQATAAKAFGGSRHGIVEGEANRNHGDALARMTADLYQDNFKTALGTATNDLNRDLSGQTSNQNAALASGCGGPERVKHGKPVECSGAKQPRSLSQANLSQQAGPIRGGGGQLCIGPQRATGYGCFAKVECGSQDAARAGQNASFAQQAGSQNANATNAVNANNAGFTQAANQFASGAANAANSLNAQLGTGANAANAGAQNQFTQNQFGADNTAAATNAAAGNQFGLANMASLNTAGQFNAGQQNAMTSGNLGFLNNAFAVQRGQPAGDKRSECRIPAAGGHPERGEQSARAIAQHAEQPVQRGPTPERRIRQSRRTEYRRPVQCQHDDGRIGKQRTGGKRSAIAKPDRSQRGRPIQRGRTKHVQSEPV